MTNKCIKVKNKTCKEFNSEKNLSLIHICFLKMKPVEVNKKNELCLFHNIYKCDSNTKIILSKFKIDGCVRIPAFKKNLMKISILIGAEKYLLSIK